MTPAENWWTFGTTKSGFEKLGPRPRKVSGPNELPWEGWIPVGQGSSIRLTRFKQLFYTFVSPQTRTPMTRTRRLLVLLLFAAGGTALYLYFSREPSSLV